MKRLLFIISALSICTIAIADQITINWGVDNQPYTTTTCTVGGDVILPSVSKRGHVFRGWTVEHFDRGTFADYFSVPTSVSLYSVNYHGVRTPQKGDFMTITDASDYHGAYDKEIYIKKYAYGNGGTGDKVVVGVNGVEYSMQRYNYYENMSLVISDIGLYITVNYSGGNYMKFYKESDRTTPYYVYYNGQVLSVIPFLSLAADSYLYYADTSITYSGTWRFVYDGIWENDGKNGWQPSEQIISE
jgi:hypothetical protein